MPAPLDVCSLFLCFSIARLRFLSEAQICIELLQYLLDYAPLLENYRSQICDAFEIKKNSVIRTPVCKNGTYRGKGGRFDFFQLYFR